MGREGQVFRRRDTRFVSLYDALELDGEGEGHKGKVDRIGNSQVYFSLPLAVT